MSSRQETEECQRFNRQLRFAIQAMSDSGMREEMLSYLNSEFGVKEKPLSWETLEHLLYNKMMLNAEKTYPPIFKAQSRLIELLIIVTEKGT